MMMTAKTMMKMALAEVDKLPSQRHFAGKQKKKRQKVRQFRPMLGHVTQKTKRAAKSSVAGGFLQRANSMRSKNRKPNPNKLAPMLLFCYYLNIIIIFIIIAKW